MKKVITIGVLIFFLFNIIAPISALETNTPVDNLTTINTNLNIQTSFLTDLWNKTFKINFQDITAENAGKTIKTWKWKANIPTKFVLENNIELNLNSTDLDKYLQKTAKFKEDIQKLNKSIWINSINQEELEVNLLPDRLQIKQNTTVKFTGKKIIETKLVEDVLENKKEQDIMKNQNVQNLNITKKLEIPKNSDEILIKNIVEECKTNSTELPTQLKWDCNYESIKNRLETIEKTLTTEEKIEISIIPPVNITNWNNLLAKDPTQVRITKDQIKNNFDLYKKLEKSANIYTVKYKWKFYKFNQKAFDKYKTNFQNKFQFDPIKNPVIGGGVSYWESGGAVIGWWVSYSEETPYIFEDISTCDRYINTQDKNNCKELFNEKTNATIVSYEKLLLNWFTIWKADSFEWSKSLSFFDYKVFKARIKVWYSFGFWVRIPIQAKVDVVKNILDDYKKDWKNNADYKTTINVDTKDISKQEFKALWISEWQTFEWNEFVLELDAYLDAGIYLRKILNEKVHFSLVDTVIRALLTYAWVSQEIINQIVTPDKWFNKSQSFKAPFAWEDTKELVNISWWISLIDSDYFVIKWWMVLLSTLDWAIKSDCENINTIWWCNTKIEYNKNSKTFTWTAVFNENDYKIDKLWIYSNFWPKLTNFEYIPQLVFKILSYGKISARVPLIDEWYSYKTPEWEIYTFSMNLPSLWAHSGTEWTIDATINNKVYTAYKNPIPLVETYSNSVESINTSLENWNEDETVISDSNIRYLFAWNKNTEWLNRIVYTLDWKDPVCSTPNVLKFKESSIWPTASKEVLSSKQITLKTMWCDIFGNKTSIKTNTYNVRNIYFEPKFRADEWISKDLLWLKLNYNDKKSYLYYKYAINSKTKGLELYANSFSWAFASSFMTYTINWENPTCTVGWNVLKYENKIPVSTLRQYLVNGPITIKAVQCINQISGMPTYSTNFSTLTLSTMPSNIDELIHSQLWTKENFSRWELLNILNGLWYGDLAWNWIWDNLWWNAGWPQISTMNMWPNGNGWNQTKHAQTKMIWCDENDIIMWNNVWASCNSDYDLNGSSYYSGSNYSSTDINGWKLWRLYNPSNLTCPNWYEIPSIEDFFNSIKNLEDIKTLKLPAAWYKPTINDIYRSKNLIWSYHIKQAPVAQRPIAFYFYANSYNPNENHNGYSDYNSIRCIRTQPTTSQEKNGNLEKSNNFSSTGSIQYDISWFNNSYEYLNVSSYYSQDEYVNEKLEEINNNFIEFYNEHLKNIDSAINKLKIEKEKVEKAQQNTYNKALEKLEEIKALFIKRYEFLKSYEEKKLKLK